MMFKIKIMLILALLLIHEQGNRQYLPTKLKQFTIYNALLYPQTPSLIKERLHPIFMFYEENLLNNDEKEPSNFTKRQISSQKIRERAREALKDPSAPVCLDIESWGLEWGERKESLNKYLKVLELFKTYNNKSKVGYFGVFPSSSPHAPYNEGGVLRESLIIPKWHETNNFFRKIGMKSDIFFPEFYTRNKNMKVWEMIVREKVAKIRSTNATGKIYGFIWPQYYTLDGKYPFIEKEVWLAQLKIVYKYCDGAVIWSHYNGPNGKPVNFSENMEWFITTKKFIKDYNIN